jgi:hypothetical protein
LIMKTKSGQITVMMIFVLAISCDTPETVVTNIVHPDGSVTRKIEMKDAEKDFKRSHVQVPYDSTWAIKDSLYINSNRDTIWCRTAIKQFKSVDEINLAYKNDSSSNRGVSRFAKFNKSFRWFNTEYRFSEVIEKRFSSGYPVSNFLDEKELKYYYTPESMQYTYEHGKDSLIYKELSRSINKKTDTWMITSLISEWSVEFSKLTEGRGGRGLELKSLKDNEEKFVQVYEKYKDKSDSLWKEGTILREMLGDENAVKFKVEADSAIEKVTRKMSFDFKEYSIKISMPGKMIDSNGFIDSTGILLWPVKSDYFLTEPYEMYAESRVSNIWAWVVSGGFVLFVIVGLVVRKIKRG